MDRNPQILSGCLFQFPDKRADVPDIPRSGQSDRLAKFPLLSSWPIAPSLVGLHVWRPMGFQIKELSNGKFGEDVRVVDGRPQGELAQRVSITVVAAEPVRFP